MPKDATKNVDRYKVRGGQFNEYDFEKDKAADKKQTATDREQMDKEQFAVPKQKVDKSDTDKSPKH